MAESHRRPRTMKAHATVATRVGNHPIDRRESTRLETEYIDNWGRKFIVYIEEPGDDPTLGNIKGPMPLDSLGLPQPLMVRLHNELYARRLLTLKDVMSRPQDVQGAIHAAMRLDIQAVQNVYRELSG